MAREGRSSLGYFHGTVAVVRFGGANARGGGVLVVVQAEHQHVVLSLTRVEAYRRAHWFPLRRERLVGQGLLVVLLLLLLLLLLFLK